jgi:ribonuclease BN (tRNA processing enzyme)
MRLCVLGCSAGVSGARRTSCLQVDDDILIDAGTGAGELSLEDMAKIDHIFLTHAHLDHMALVPMLVDAAAAMRDRPVTVHGLPETIDTLKECIFNWRVWPDFSVLPSEGRPWLRYQPLAVGEAVGLGGGRRITPLPVKHAVPAVGYQVDSGTASLAISGDTTLHDGFWEALNGIENLEYLLIETTYLNANEAMAPISGHMTPALLAEGLGRLRRPVQVFITHLEPGREDETMEEILRCAAGNLPAPLRQGQVFELGSPKS